MVQKFKNLEQLKSRLLGLRFLNHENLGFSKQFSMLICMNGRTFSGRATMMSRSMTMVTVTQAETSLELYLK